MSRNLVTLEQASAHLRRDTSDDDADLNLKIGAASEAIITYLKAGATFLNSSGQVPVNSSGVPIVPFPIQAACLLLVGEFYKNREGDQGGEFSTSTTSRESVYGYGYLPKPVVALLFPLRDPALA